ncbi:hypothetical protein [Bacillus sp. 03113]|uniref:hypothetical protein n=1 Tax=Bacillus sp. 03113 TaxID=2578211 RepID=UPI001144FB27|nr:hypothetical protein [Bacillus sp. 03113]
MKKQKYFFLSIGLLLLLTASFYFDSPFSILNQDYVYYTNGNTSVKPVHLLKSDQQSKPQPALEMLLVRSHKEDGYIVETYREYEIYRNSENKIIKKIPTLNYQYLKYKK